MRLLYDENNSSVYHNIKIDAVSTWSYAIFKTQKYPNKEPTILSLWSGSSKSRFHGKTTSISQGR